MKSNGNRRDIKRIIASGMVLLAAAFAVLCTAQPVCADSASVAQTCPDRVHAGCSHSGAWYHFYSTGVTYLPEGMDEHFASDLDYCVEGLLYNAAPEAEGPYQGMEKVVCAWDTSYRYTVDFFMNGYSEGWYYFGGDGLYPCTLPADAVIEKINAIGTVEYTEASKEKIDDARAAYDALTDEQKALITAAQLKILTDAEAEYAALKAAAESETTDGPVLAEGEFAVMITLDGQPVTSPDYGTVAIGSKSALRLENNAYIFPAVDPNLDYTLFTGNYLPARNIEKELLSGKSVFAVAFYTAEPPRAVAGLVYNGKEQIGIEGGSNYILCTGEEAAGSTDRAVDAGSYTACVIPKDDSYVWGVLDFGVKEIGWTIAPANGEVDPDIPKTGDPGRPLLWAVLLGAALAGMALQKRKVC